MEKFMDGIREWVEVVKPNTIMGLWLLLIGASIGVGVGATFYSPDSDHQRLNEVELRLDALER